MRTFIPIALLAGAAWTLPATAQVSCLTPYPNPSAPGAGEVSISFNASWSSSESMTFVLWRQPCAEDPARTFLWLRVIPTQGSPFVCSSSFSVIQAGEQKKVKLTKVAAGSSQCDDVLVPTTFIVQTGSNSASINNNAAITLVYHGLIDYSATLPAYVQAPDAGLWWNEAESGTGYALDVKHGVLVVTTYSYTPDGAPVWYISSGPIVNNVFQGTLDKYRKGQCIGCPYPGRPESAGNDGVVRITFHSNISATMELPGGRSIPITPQPF